MRTVEQVLSSLKRPEFERLEPPLYRYQENGDRLALAVPSMKNHMSDEGWQLMLSLQSGGYKICGAASDNVDIPVTDLSVLMRENPSVVVLQDKREWGDRTNPLNHAKERFTCLGSLKERESTFKLTILKDSHQRPPFHIQSAKEIDCHAWIVYYHPLIVSHLAPYIRKEHLIRTYHSVDPVQVPVYLRTRKKCILSGCLGTAYPLRTRIAKMNLEEVEILGHPGYHNKGTNTNAFLQTLSCYKVAICTSSLYGYALRKIIEATACGCVVLTDLPKEDVLPGIDDNLVRLNSYVSRRELQELLNTLCSSYDMERQKHFSSVTKSEYSYKVIGSRLASDIESLRKTYANVI